MILPSSFIYKSNLFFKVYNSLIPKNLIQNLWFQLLNLKDEMKKRHWKYIRRNIYSKVQIICYPWRLFRFLLSFSKHMMIGGYLFHSWWSHQPNIRQWSFGFSLMNLWHRLKSNKWLSWFFSLVRRQQLAFWQHLQYRFWWSLLLVQQWQWP